MYARLSSPPLAQQVYARRFVGNYVATYQSRAAIALGLIGTPRAQAILLNAARNDTTSRVDVLQAIGTAAPISLTVAAGDSQSAPADSTVRIDPSVLLTDVRDSAAPRPLADVRVVFRVESGGGRVGADSVQRTSANGTAAVRWQLGPGGNSVNILRVVAAGRTVRFRATGRGFTPRLAFVVQPHDGRSGQPMDTVVVAVLDAWDQQAANFSASVDLTVPGTPFSLLQPTSAGVAFFPGIVLNFTGTGFRFRASAAGAAEALSAPFDILP